MAAVTQVWRLLVGAPQAYRFFTPQTVYLQRPGEEEVDAMVRISRLPASDIVQVRRAAAAFCSRRAEAAHLGTRVHGSRMPRGEQRELLVRGRRLASAWRLLPRRSVPRTHACVFAGAAGAAEAARRAQLAGGRAAGGHGAGGVPGVGGTCERRQRRRPACRGCVRACRASFIISCARFVFCCPSIILSVHMRLETFCRSLRFVKARRLQPLGNRRVQGHIRARTRNVGKHAVMGIAAREES